MVLYNNGSTRRTIIIKHSIWYLSLENASENGWIELILSTENQIIPNDVAVEDLIQFLWIQRIKTQMVFWREIWGNEATIYPSSTLEAEIF